MENHDNSTKEQLVKEIDQLKAKVAELEKSELKSSLWLENSPVCTKIVDLDFNLQYMSSSGVKELNIDDISEFYGKPYPLHFYPDSFKIPMIKNLKKVKETGEMITQEATINDIDGKVLWYHSTIVPVKDEKGELDYLMVVSLETTGRKTIEKELQESYSLLNSIIESPDNIIMFALDTDYNYLGFNNAHAKEMKFIYDANIEIGKHIIDYIPSEEDRAKVLVNYKRVLKGERFIEIQKYGDADNRFWYELIFNPIYEESKKITGFTVFVTNITDRKIVEEELRRTSDYLENLINYANAPIIVWDPDFNITRFNNAFENLTGYKSNEVVGEKLDLLFPEDSAKDTLLKIEQTLEGEKWDSVEIPIIRKDGEVRIALWNSASLYAEDGKTVVSIIAQGQDITDRKNSERALRQSEEMFGGFIESAIDGIVIYDSDLNLVEINQAAMKIFPAGSSRNKMIGMNMLEIVPSLKDSERYDMYANVIKTGESLLINDLVPVPQFGDLHLTLKAFKVGDGLGIIFTDITESKKIEKEIAQHRQHLEVMINERTKELNEKNKKLDDAMKVFVGREMTIRNLQDRIKALEGK